jgi:hypothetical protein
MTAVLAADVSFCNRKFVLSLTVLYLPQVVNFKKSYFGTYNGHILTWGNNSGLQVYTPESMNFQDLRFS